MKLVSAESSEKKRKGILYILYIASCLHTNPQNWKRQLCNGDQTKRFHYVSGVQSHSMFEGDVTTVACAAQSCAKSVPSFFCSVKHVSAITIDCKNSFIPHIHTYIQVLLFTILAAGTPCLLHHPKRKENSRRTLIRMKMNTKEYDCVKHVIN